MHHLCLFLYLRKVPDVIINCTPMHLVFENFKLFYFTKKKSIVIPHFLFYFFLIVMQLLKPNLFPFPALLAMHLKSSFLFKVLFIFSTLYFTLYFPSLIILVIQRYSYQKSIVPFFFPIIFALLPFI